MIKLCILFSASTALLVDPTAATAAQPRVQPPATILEPAHDERVSPMHPVSGKVRPGTAGVWLVSQPLETNDCWIQTPAIVNSDGTWKVIARFGEDRPEHSGKRYEIRAFISPQKPVQPGKTNCWPAAGAYSDPVYVIRK